MALYLVQHGKSLSKDQDPEQGLSEEGIKIVEKIAETAEGHNLKIGLIEHSVKARAKQTAEIFASKLNPENGVQERVGIKPMDDVEAVAGQIINSDNLMLVGHLPFMERLTSHLITGSLDPPVLKFQNGGIVCLDKSADEKWIIKWTIMPEIG
jgi:phosphohistidine phosphatase